MNILMIGAAGKTGSLVVERAVIVGHSVTALVHRADSYQDHPHGVRIVAGDAADAEVLDQAMKGQDAVIDTIGGKTPYRQTELEQSVAKAVIAAMQRAGVRRLIAVSALGVGDSKDQSGFLYEHLVLPTFLRGSTQDKEVMERAVKQSGLQFLLLRPAVLNDHPATGSVRVVTGQDKAHKITRADLAQFIIDQLQSDQYLNQAITIANN